MKSIIIYHSFSGNTKKVAQALAEYLKTKGDVETLELKDLDDNGNFFSQGSRAIKKERAKINEIKLDLSEYDLICLGSPVWAFGTTPAMNSFLDKCSGVVNKRIILFTTSGGMGDDKCMDYMQGILEKKGTKEFSRFSIHGSKVNNREFVLSRIKEVI